MTLAAPEKPDTLNKNVMHLSMTIDRDALAEAVKEGKREISGLAVPYDVEIARRDWYYGTSKLKIAQDAATVRDDAKLFFGHDHIALGMPIGRITGWANEAGGLRITASLSKTAKADEVYELLQDGTLDKFSIGFYYVSFSIEEDGELLVHTEIDVFETSVVSYPAFDGAAVDSVLSAPNKGIPPMTQSTQVLDRPAAPDAFSAEDGEQLRTSIDKLAAKVATINTASTAPDNPAAMFSSYGEYVKAMIDVKHELHADAQKLATTLAYDGGVSEDTIYGDSTWIGDITRIIEVSRRTWNLFDSAPLPAEGNKLEYGKVVENTIKVRRQIAEGDKLVMGKIKVGTDYADVYTFGGASEMTFQQAKRSSIPVLDFTWRALARAYGITTEQYAQYVLNGVSAKTIGTLGGLSSVEGWIKFLIDVALHFKDKGLAPEYLRITPDVYLTLATLRLGTDGPFLLDRSSGSVNLMELTGNVGGLRLELTAGTKLVEVGNSFALKTLESAGAPTRLGPQEDILHLTEAVGVYGFDAIAVQDNEAIVRPSGVTLPTNQDIDGPTTPADPEDV